MRLCHLKHFRIENGILHASRTPLRRVRLLPPPHAAASISFRAIVHCRQAVKTLRPINAATLSRTAADSSDKKQHTIAAEPKQPFATQTARLRAAVTHFVTGFARQAPATDAGIAGKEDLMASGWAGDNAVQDQIQDSINDEVARARRNLPRGESLTHCEECGEEIPQARRDALPGVRLCIACQQEADKEQQTVALYNRRGSKDSQLR